MAPRRKPRVTVFGPTPLLSITIERRGEADDDIHLHAGGQGVWVARMAGELGAHPLLCGLVGGETGALLGPLLAALPGEVRAVATQSASGCYVVDRRTGERRMLASSWARPASRHEADDLFSVTTAAALDSAVLVVCGATENDTLPPEQWRNLVADARAGEATVIVDLGSPGLERALEGGPDLVHLNDWQLAELVAGPVSGPGELRAAAGRLLELGAGAAVITRGADPALVLRDGDAWELVPPRFEGGAPEGCGDALVGGLAAGLARGLGFEDAVRLGAAAGAANFLRHGLGTAERAVVESLVEQVELRPL